MDEISRGDRAEEWTQLAFAGLVADCQQGWWRVAGAEQMGMTVAVRVLPLVGNTLAGRAVVECRPLYCLACRDIHDKTILAFQALWPARGCPATACTGMPQRLRRISNRY